MTEQLSPTDVPGTDQEIVDAVTLDTVQNAVAVDPDKLYTGIDLAETLSCLTGKWIKRITADTVEFQDGSSANFARRNRRRSSR